MAQRVYPCLCGVSCETYAKMRLHRERCATWLGRPNPKALAKERRSSWRSPPPLQASCEVCGGRWDHHLEGCQNSFEQRSRRALLERYSIPPAWFDRFLEVLGRRYLKRKL